MKRLSNLLMRDIPFKKRLDLILVSEFSWGRRGRSFTKIAYAPMLLALGAMLSLVFPFDDLFTLFIILLIIPGVLLYFYFGNRRKRIKGVLREYIRLRKKQITHLYIVYGVIYWGTTIGILLLVEALKK